MLAEQIAKSLELPLIQWHIKSTTKAQQGLYEYDAVSRLQETLSSVMIKFKTYLITSFRENLSLSIRKAVGSINR